MSIFFKGDQADTLGRAISATPMQEAQKRGGLFSGGLRDVLGAVGDALLVSNGIQPMYQRRRLQAEKTQQEAAQAEAQRQAEFAQWRQRYDYETNNPRPTNNDTVNDYNFISQNLGKDAADQYLRNLGDPMATIPLANGRIYSGPRSGLGAALGGMGGGQPAAPVGKLTPLGGGVSNGTGNFPPRR